MAETGLAPFFSLLEEQLMQIISDKIKEVQDFFNTPGHAQKRVLLNVINEMALYEKHPMPNYWLAKLITGRTVEMVYYDPWLARIKDFIHHHPFCSVIDYAGGVGPVMITRRHYQA
jgi:hypothetical protein